MQFYAITVAAILDTIDGRIARLIKGTSKFGAELDSLIDFLNFGVAPAHSCLFCIFKKFWKLRMVFGSYVIVHVVVCVLLDLILRQVYQKWRENFFTGVPSPSGAGILLLPLIFSLS